MSKSCIGLTWKNYLKTGDTKSAKKIGRPRKLSERSIRQLVRGITDNPFISPRKLRSEYLTNQDKSTRTIQRILVDQNCKSYRSLKKPCLKPYHKAARKEFCQNYLNKTTEFWEN